MFQNSENGLQGNAADCGREGLVNSASRKGREGGVKGA